MSFDASGEASPITFRKTASGYLSDNSSNFGAMTMQLEEQKGKKED
jgi:hypothetical protein